MTRLKKSLEDLTYSSVASAILLELYAKTPLRSSVLVSSVETKLSCSRTLIYQVLRELRDKTLIHLPTERKRMKFYALTKQGRELIEEEINKNVAELRQFSLSIPKPDITALELLADEVLNDLPPNMRSPSVRMLIRRKLKKSVEDMKDEISQS